MKSSPMSYGLERVAEIVSDPPTSMSTVRHWIADGRLPSFKVGRRRLVRRSDLAAFLGVPAEELP